MKKSLVFDQKEVRQQRVSSLRHTRWYWPLVFMTALLGIGLLSGIYWKYHSDRDAALHNYRAEAHEHSLQVADTFNDNFRLLYQGLRTIALLPGVRHIDRHGITWDARQSKKMDADARGSVQQLYNNLALNTALSEVYIVPLDLEPDRIDPYTGKPGVPITTFDELIVGKTEGSQSKAGDEKEAKDKPVVEEIEIYEYRLMKKQLAWLRAHFSSEQNIKGFAYPAVSGPEVITCDNSRYSPAHPDNKDRSGLVYSVPFYSPDGKLKGCISGVFLTHALRDLVPTGEYVLCNPRHRYAAVPNQPGAWLASASFATRALADPALLYSEALPVAVTDANGQWMLWAGQSNAAFWKRSEVKALRQFAVWGCMGTLLLVGGLLTALWLIDSKQMSLRASEERCRAVLENVKDVIFTMDMTGNWTFLNPAWIEITGFSLDESLGKCFLSFIHEEDQAYCLTVLETMRQEQKNYESHETRFKCKGGDLRWVEVRVQSTLDDSGALTGFFGTLCDITERKAGAERLEHQSLHDALTGLPNRLLFQDRLASALARMARLQSGVAVLFVDLDNFKSVNDSLGHEAGDTLLQTVAQRIHDAARRGDTVARLGGDEFTLLLENIAHAEEAAQTAERILAHLQQPIALGTHQAFASASIGIAFSDDETLTAEDLLRNADTAMYQAKTHGKAGFVVFDPTMNADALERMEIETGLRFAVERGELRVHYQPLIDLESGCMNGVEALVRWQHPTKGLIPPGKFIGIAEDSGLILPIGYWVLEEACRQMQAWKAQYPDYGAFTVNVNLSGKQLQRPDVVERVRGILAQTGVEARQVKLEITESVMMADIDDTVAKLHALKGLGVKLALDDFGTGYSSMANLNLFPLDTVKIDRAFIQRLTEHAESASVVAAIIMLSKALHLDVTGEGVETAEQLAQLQELGCHIGQGYYFAKPLPATHLSDGMAAGPHHFAQTIEPMGGAGVEPAAPDSVEKYLRAA